MAHGGEYGRHVEGERQRTDTDTFNFQAAGEGGVHERVMRPSYSPMILNLVSRRGLDRAFSRSASRLSTALLRGAPIDIHPEVQDALNSAQRKPVVALETALCTHGLPPPINLQVTRDLEAVVRTTGCVPATIGIVAGRVKIGLENSDLERLADVNATRNPPSVKISRRDIAAAIAMKADGGTTICATTIFAALAGIKVFATGGLGGVHRGGENSMDVSADLHELARCPVGVVSAGVKSILDIGRTLEYLETLGVPVISYSKTKDFPAFFSRTSGFQTPWNVSDPITAAKILYHQFQLGMDNGALIAVPIPEEHSEKGEAIQKAVNQAVIESESNGMSRSGKDVTPYLLGRVAELTKNDSIESNIALLKNTAVIGGQIAVEYHTLVDQLPNSGEKQYAIRSADNQRDTSHSTPATRAKVLVVGSAALDITAQARDVTPVGAHSTLPGTVFLQPGGVAQNIAQACHRLGQPPLLISPIGEDAWGRLLSDEIAAIGMKTEGLIVNSSLPTAVCNLFLDGTGNLVGGVADMAITEDTDLLESVTSHLETSHPAVVAMDANLSPDCIRDIIRICGQQNVQTLFEPTSVTKSSRILPAIEHALKKSSEPPVTFFTPNILELREVHRQATESGLTSSSVWWSIIDRLSLGESFRMDIGQLAKTTVVNHEGREGDNLAFLKDQGVVQMATALTPFFRHMFIKCGEKGVLAVVRLSGEDAHSSEWAHERSNPSRRYIVAHSDSRDEILVCQFFPPNRAKVVSSTGAGDSLVGALLASLQGRPDLLKSPAGLERLIGTCQKAAVLTLESQCSVSPLLNTLSL